MISNKKYNSKKIFIKIKEYYNFREKIPGKILFKFYNIHNKKIAEISTLQFHGKKFETHSYISSYSNIGKGLGLYMYSVVTDWFSNHKLELYSAEIASQSNDAKYLWKSKRLRQKYYIRKTLFKSCEYSSFKQKNILRTEYRWKITPLIKSSGITPNVLNVKRKKSIYQPQIIQHVALVEKNLI